MAPDSDDRPVTRRECERCPVHTEVADMGKKIEKVDAKADKTDGRMWTIGVGLVFTLLSSLTTLAVLLFKSAPVVAAVAK